MKPFLILLLVYNSILVYFSLISVGEVAKYPLGWIIFLHGGFYVHLVSYLILTLLWGLYGLKKYKCLMISLITGILLEILQLSIPDRFSSLTDILANSMGAVIGYILLGLGCFLICPYFSIRARVNPRHNML